MKPIKLTINMDASDHYMYNGALYVVLSDGGIISIRLSEICSKLKEKYSLYPGISGLLDLSFRRNLYWRSNPVQNFISIPEVREGLVKAWKRFSACAFELDLADLECETIVKDIPSEVLDISIYGNSIYLSCLSGLYKIDLNSERKRQEKIFDGKSYKISTGYSNVILSMGADGISRFNPFIDEYVEDRSHLDCFSLSTRWTPAGSLMNYNGFSQPQFISNTIKNNESKNNESGAKDRYMIDNFAEEITALNSLVKEAYREMVDESSLLFNGVKRQYAYGSKGSLFGGDLRVRDGRLSSVVFNKIVTGNKYKFDSPLSGMEVADYPLIEFEDTLCLFQNEDEQLLEEEPLVSIHTYPSSTHFRDIVSVTGEDSIRLHSIDVISKPNIDIHPVINRRKQEPKLHEGVAELLDLPF